MNSTEKKGALIGKTVLIVDDYADSIEALSLWLRSLGAVVIEAPSAAAGFAALRQHHPHVLIADLNMPGESGFEFIAKIRALPAEEGGGTPAVALSALGPEAVRPALEAGFSPSPPIPPKSCRR
jgi:CheY-like chemotaxis protein